MLYGPSPQGHGIGRSAACVHGPDPVTPPRGENHRQAHPACILAARAAGQGTLSAWYADAQQAGWASPDTIQRRYRSASILRNGRVVFNIAGNKYRLVVRINYHYRVVYIRFVGTHAEYDRADAEAV
jgi:mRNA interferase HigB